MCIFNPCTNCSQKDRCCAGRANPPFCALVKEATWPALSKMAKQYLAAPASSAGVERIFSAAGKMHSDLRKSMSDDSLKHSLFAAFNTK